MIELVATIHLIGAAQGLFLGFIQISRRKNRYANNLFAVLIILLSLFMLHKYFMLCKMLLPAYALRFINLPAVFLFGPLIYLYTLSMTSGLHSLRIKDLIHFMPSFIFLIFSIAINVFGPPHSSAAHDIKLPPQGKPAIAFIAITSASAVVGLLYTIASWKILIKYSHDIKEFFSDIKRLNLFWLRILIGCWFILFLSVNISQIIIVNKIIHKELFFLISIFFVIIIYISSFFALRHPDLFKESIILRSKYDRPAESQKPHETMEKYKRHSINETNSKIYLMKLLAYMEQEKPYLDENLTLKNLAEKVEMLPHHLSIVINLHLKQNFYTFVNYYRVKEVKERFTASMNNDATILTTAFECGFNSKSTFNSMFKKFTGMTPGECRKKNSASQWNSEIFSSDLTSKDDN